MAYVSQEKKKELAPLIKAVLSKYAMKGSIAVDNHSSLVVNLKSGPLDFGSTNTHINPYWYQEHYTGKVKEFLTELIAAMKSGGWYNKSDIQTDYFNAAWYIDINVGKWNKPYEVTK